MMPFNAPLISSKRFSTREASAASVWRRTSLVALAGTSTSISAVAAVTAAVIASMSAMKLAAAVAFCAAEVSESTPATVSSVFVSVHANHAVDDIDNTDRARVLLNLSIEGIDDAVGVGDLTLLEPGGCLRSSGWSSADA